MSQWEHLLNLVEPQYREAIAAQKVPSLAPTVPECLIESLQLPATTPKCVPVDIEKEIPEQYRVIFPVLRVVDVCGFLFILNKEVDLTYTRLAELCQLTEEQTRNAIEEAIGADVLNAIIDDENIHIKKVRLHRLISIEHINYAQRVYTLINSRVNSYN